MAEMEGWIKLHRKITLNELWKAEPFSRGQAWVDLILLANHKDGSIRVRGIKVPVLRGQVGWSELKLSERWKWSRSKVRKFLRDLEEDEQIIQETKVKERSDFSVTKVKVPILEQQKEQQKEQQINKLTSIITIVNYDLYQEKEQQKEQQSERQKDNRRTSKEQQKDTNKNVKNDNNENNEKKSKYADFVSMTEEEHQKLIEQFGEQGTAKRIEDLNLYKGSKGVKYKSDYLTILNWARKESPQKQPAVRDKQKEAELNQYKIDHMYDNPILPEEYQ